MIEVYDLPSLEQQPRLREVMHEQRFRSFKVRQDWDVPSINGYEIDQFDRRSANPIYLIARAGDGRLVGSCRLLQMSGPNMLHDVFHGLTGDLNIPCSPDVWECTRYTVEPRAGKKTVDPRYAAELFAGLCEWGIPRGMTQSVGVADISLVRFMRRLGINARWTSKPITIGNTETVIACFEISAASHQRILDTAPLGRSVIRLDTTSPERSAA